VRQAHGGDRFGTHIGGVEDDEVRAVSVRTVDIGHQLAVSLTGLGGAIIATIPAGVRIELSLTP
jgi:hypothetical protein